MPSVLEATELYRFYHAGDEETLALRGVSLGVNTVIRATSRLDVSELRDL